MLNPVNPAETNVFDVRAYGAPIAAKRQADARNAFEQMQQAPSQQASTQYNALAQYGGPTKAAGAAVDGDMAKRIYGGLVERGLPSHVAEGFVLNMKDESGLNPGINEAAPIVPGSRGGFGLYQLTGPRRRAYESYAQERGVPVDDVDVQLDFLMTELQGPESRAARNIFAADTTGEAATAIVNDFLRPAPEHRASRSQRYSQYSGGMAQTLADLGL